MKSINKFFNLKLNQPKFILILWLSVIALSLFLVLQAPPQINFPYYQTDLRSHYSRLLSIPAHFDGIHYLRIAQYGYQDTGIQAFFPLYPSLIYLVNFILPSPLFSAIFISFISIIVAYFGLKQLFPQTSQTLYYLLFFPTSFFLLTVYTEPLFLALSVWFFILLKRQKWLLSALLAGLASSTRLVGSILVLSLIIEYCRHHKSRLAILPLSLISLSGIMAYMYFLNQKFGDPLMFVHVQAMFGAQRTTDQLILLPQVLYRYFKMFLTTPFFSNLSARIYLEFSTFIYAGYLLLKHWGRRGLSLNLYLLISLILPTLTGTLSSMPRYVLVLIPFLVLTHSSTKLSLLKLSLRVILLVFFTFQFATGIFVA